MEDEKRKIGGPGWALIPPAIMMTTELTPREKLIWGRINGLINVRGYCWATNEMLAEQIQVKANTMSDIISDMVRSGYMKRKLVYRKGKEEFIYNEKPSGEELKGKKYIERRLCPAIPETVAVEEKTDSEVHPAEKGYHPDEKRDKELEMSIRQEEKGKTEQKDKEEKPDCGIAAVPPLKTKDSTTKTTQRPQLRNGPSTIPPQNRPYFSHGCITNTDPIRVSIAGRTEHILKKHAENVSPTVTEKNYPIHENLDGNTNPIEGT